MEFADAAAVGPFQWFMYDHYHHLLENYISLQWMYHNLHNEIQYELSCILQNLYLLVHVASTAPQLLWHFCRLNC